MEIFREDNVFVSMTFSHDKRRINEQGAELGQIIARLRCDGLLLQIASNDCVFLFAERTQAARV
jgi:hypothetical protein